MKYFVPVLGLLLLWGCGKQAEQTVHPGELNGKQLEIVTTTGMIGDAVRNIAAGHANVVSLMGPGVDPHLYKASAGDVARMQKADIIFYNGLHLEGKMSEIFENMHSRIRTEAVTEGIAPERLQSSELFKGNYDPHVWFDVALWEEVVQNIARTLQEADPENAGDYTANLQTYRTRLQLLHREVGDLAASVPAEHRVLITAHDAFNYFGRAYGFEVRGLQGISTASETGAGDVQELADFIVERKIPAIFVESSVPPRYIEALRAAVISRGHQVTVGGSLFSDAMGNPGTPEGEYLGMVRYNIRTIVGALGGTIAAGQHIQNE